MHSRSTHTANEKDERRHFNRDALEEGRSFAGSLRSYVLVLRWLSRELTSYWHL